MKHAAGRWRDGWYVVPHQVIFRDVDAYGHVNNAVFFTYFEWARTLLWFELTGGSGARDIGFIVARAECDFRLQLELEPIEIRVRISDMRQTSLDFTCEIWKGDGQQLAASGKVVVVLFDWSTHSKRPITEEFRGKVQSLQTSEA
jgi:acyl-CoA thioester hydrolase